MTKSVSEFASKDVSYLSDFLLEAWRKSGPSSFGWTGATDDNIAEMASEDFLRGLLKNPALAVFVGKADKCIVGFCVTRVLSANIIELAGIIVREDWVGKGIGSSLLKMAKTKAISKGYEMMFVKTESSNLRSLRFYLERGFMEEKEVVEEINNRNVNLTVLKCTL